jgi:uncharacterized membrane protein
MTLFEILLFLHIVAAMVWVGGSILLGFVGARVQGTGDPDLRLRFSRAAGVVGPVIGVSAALVLASGTWMVLESEAIELSQTWVWLGLALFVVSSIVGASFFGPASRKIERALEAGDVADADRRARTFNLVSRLDTLLLLVIVGLMVFQPGAEGGH